MVKNWNLKVASLLVYVLALFPFLSVSGQTNIIPMPVDVQMGRGSFVINGYTTIKFEGEPRFAQLASYLQRRVADISAYTLTLNGEGKNDIIFAIRKIDSIGEEGYVLDITPEQIRIEANTERGLFYAVQSLLQQLPAIRTNEELHIPAMKVIDYPNIAWRGMMLDVSRHFYSVEAIKDILDLLAGYKMNVFHWHLTDNEGWRLEIKRYPKLTEVAAWRDEVYGSLWYVQDSTLDWKNTYRYGGYYTQEQAREIVAYAAARNITVIPEIEMPGHSGGVLAAYPELSCNHAHQPVPNSAIFNKSNPTPSNNQEYCAGNDAVFGFLEDILTEVMDIFPSTYIHIGGDEVDKTHWKACAKCQQRIKDEGLQNEDELQSYFVRRIEKFLTAKSRKLLGWDEILEGGLASSATVMSWRGEKGGIEAAEMGHDVIMSPSDPLYFNRYQTDPEGEPLAAKYSINTLERVYHYNPYTTALSAGKLRYIKGVQFAIWTEYISSVEHLEYMLLPRMPALAEVAWTPESKRDFESFKKRLNMGHFTAWSQLGIRFNQLFYRK